MEVSGASKSYKGRGGPAASTSARDVNAGASPGVREVTGAPFAWAPGFASSRPGSSSSPSEDVVLCDSWASTHGASVEGCHAGSSVVHLANAPIAGDFDLRNGIRLPEYTRAMDGWDSAEVVGSIVVLDTSLAEDISLTACRGAVVSYWLMPESELMLLLEAKKPARSCCCVANPVLTPEKLLLSATTSKCGSMEPTNLGVCWAFASSNRWSTRLKRLLTWSRGKSLQSSPKGNSISTAMKCTDQKAKTMRKV
mmetsp:Transcript_59446/g.164433  ORF Transcript_59446/g.164433 Transcript_59446/m.164433 type:complete len:253 (-) Transcript_59446:46-804(-)